MEPTVATSILLGDLLVYMADTGGGYVDGAQRIFTQDADGKVTKDAVAVTKLIYSALKAGHTPSLPQEKAMGTKKLVSKRGKIPVRVREQITRDARKAAEAFAGDPVAQRKAYLKSYQLAYDRYMAAHSAEWRARQAAKMARYVARQAKLKKAAAKKAA
jgi:hypothetical protein